MKFISKKSIFLVSLILIFLSIFSATKLPELLTIYRAKRILNENPDFESHLFYYSRFGKKWDEKLKFIHKVKGFTEKLHSFSDEFKINRFKHEVGTLDCVVGKLDSIRLNFEHLVELEEVALASKAFRNDSNEENLLKLGKLCEDKIDILIQNGEKFRYFTASIPKLNSNINETIDSLDTKIEKAETSKWWDIPQKTEATLAKGLLALLKPNAEKVNELATYVETINTQIPSDIATMKTLSDMTPGLAN